MRRKFWRLPAVALMVLLLTPLPSGCSFVFVDGPSSDAARRSGTCTDGYGWPMADVFFTTLGLVGAMVLVAQSTTRSDNGVILVQAMSGLTGVTLYGASAVTGFIRVSDCRASETIEGDTRSRSREERKAIKAAADAVAQQRLRQKQADEAAAAKGAGQSAPDAGSADGGPVAPSASPAH